MKYMMDTDGLATKLQSFSLLALVIKVSRIPVVWPARACAQPVSAPHVNAQQVTIHDALRSRRVTSLRRPSSPHLLLPRFPPMTSLPMVVGRTSYHQRLDEAVASASVPGAFFFFPGNRAWSRPTLTAKIVGFLTPRERQGWLGMRDVCFCL